MVLPADRQRQEFSNYHPSTNIIVDVDSPLVIVLPTAGAFVQATRWIAGPIPSNTSLTPDPSAGGITVEETAFGVYMIYNNCSFFASKANVIITAGIFLNGTIENELRWTRSLKTANSVGNAGFSQPLALVTGDEIDFRFACDTNNVTVTLEDGGLGLTRLSGE